MSRNHLYDKNENWCSQTRNHHYDGFGDFVNKNNGKQQIHENHRYDGFGTFAVKPKERKPLHAPKSGLEGVLREVKNGKSQSYTSKNNKQEDSDDDMDESFYPSDDEDSDYDSDDSRKRKRYKQNRKNRDRVKRTKSDDCADGSLNSSSEISSSDAEMVVLPINKELTKYTVKDLKELLSSRGLKVSGVKEDLIQRLQSFESNMTSMSTDITLTEPVDAVDPPVFENVFASVISSPFGGILQKTASSSSSLPAPISTGQPSADEPDKPDSAAKQAPVQQISSETAKDVLKSISVDTQLFPASDPNFFKRKLNNPDNDENVINLPLVETEDEFDRNPAKHLEVAMDTEDFASL